MTVNSELRLGINPSFIAKWISRLNSRGAPGTQTGTRGTHCWAEKGDEKSTITKHENRTVSGEHRAIATERRGLKHLIRFWSEVKRTQFKTNATLPLVEQRGSSSMNNSLLSDSQAVFLLYFVHALEPILWSTWPISGRYYRLNIRKGLHPF